jgi:hypothetical protein
MLLYLWDLEAGGVKISGVDYGQDELLGIQEMRQRTWRRKVSRTGSLSRDGGSPGQYDKQRKKRRPVVLGGHWYCPVFFLS